jgi:hypothetical protein
MTENQSVDEVAELAIAPGGGVWRVESTSATIYWVDLDAMVLLRQPGTGSPTGIGDGTWSDLLRVESTDDTGLIRVGRRHKYTLDPGGAFTTWWIQRAATTIRRVAPDQRPAGRPPADADGRPFAVASGSS